MASDAMNGPPGHSLRAYPTWAARTESEDIEEFPLLLSSSEVSALIEAARRQGISAAGLARQLVIDYLGRTRGVARAGTDTTGRSWP
jgi:hypothetical protein